MNEFIYFNNTFVSLSKCNVGLGYYVSYPLLLCNKLPKPQRLKTQLSHSFCGLGICQLLTHLILAQDSHDPVVELLRRAAVTSRFNRVVTLSRLIHRALGRPPHSCAGTCPQGCLTTQQLDFPRGGKRGFPRWRPPSSMT